MELEHIHVHNKTSQPKASFLKTNCKERDEQMIAIKEKGGYIEYE